MRPGVGGSTWMGVSAGVAVPSLPALTSWTSSSSSSDANSSLANCTSESEYVTVQPSSDAMLTRRMGACASAAAGCALGEGACLLADRAAACSTRGEVLAEPLLPRCGEVSMLNGDCDSRRLNTGSDDRDSRSLRDNGASTDAGAELVRRMALTAEAAATSHGERRGTLSGVRTRCWTSRDDCGVTWRERSDGLCSNRLSKSSFSGLARERSPSANESLSTRSDSRRARSAGGTSMGLLCLMLGRRGDAAACDITTRPGGSG
jgi:hypothetical protein